MANSTPQDLVSFAESKGLLNAASTRDSLGSKPPSTKNLAESGILSADEWNRLENEYEAHLSQNPHADAACARCGGPMRFDGAMLRCDPCRVSIRPWSASPEETTVAPAHLPAEVAEAAADPANRFGKYVRLNLLAKGGMGKVYRACDTKLRRFVALKFLRDPDPAEVQRFMREAHTVGKLSHPHIATIHDIGRANDQHYIAMHLIEGQTLAAYPRDDRRRLVEFVRDAARAVHYAHGQGVVHRDLKPANLMVMNDHLYVMDFPPRPAVGGPGGPARPRG